MQKQRSLAVALLLSLAALPLSACAPGDTGTANIPANVKAFALKVPKVENSRNSPCWQQKQIARQQAFLESTSTGEIVVRRVVCGKGSKPKVKRSGNEAA